MITSHFIPPHSPDALAIAHTLLAIAADPAGCKARLDELMRVRADAQDAVRALEDQGRATERSSNPLPAFGQEKMRSRRRN